MSQQHPKGGRNAAQSTCEANEGELHSSVAGAHSYFFPWNVKSCEWFPVTVLMEVAVTEPPDATDVNCEAVQCHHVQVTEIGG